MKNKITFLILFIVLGSSSLQAQVTQEWVQRYNGLGNSLAVDDLGNVYVTGWGNGDYATIKYNSSGDSLWVARYNGTENTDDRASSLAVDGSGNVYVTGWGNGGYATVKYNSSGVQQWAQKYEVLVTGNLHYPSLVVDGSGNVYVTGQVNRGGTGLDYTTIKYNSSGDSIWVARYNGPGNGDDYALSVAVDGWGNVYVTGESRGSGTSTDYATIKYNSSGDSLWVARYNGPSNWYDNASSIAVDRSGNVYVTGYSTGSASGTDYATIKYNSSVSPAVGSNL